VWGARTRSRQQAAWARHALAGGALPPPRTWAISSLSWTDWELHHQASTSPALVPASQAKWTAGGRWPPSWRSCSRLRRWTRLLLRGGFLYKQAAASRGLRPCTLFPLALPLLYCRCIAPLSSSPPASPAPSLMASGSTSRSLQVNKQLEYAIGKTKNVEDAATVSCFCVLGCGSCVRPLSELVVSTPQIGSCLCPMLAACSTHAASSPAGAWHIPSLKSLIPRCSCASSPYAGPGWHGLRPARQWGGHAAEQPSHPGGRGHAGPGAWPASVHQPGRARHDWEWRQWVSQRRRVRVTGRRLRRGQVCVRVRAHVTVCVDGWWGELGGGDLLSPLSLPPPPRMPPQPQRVHVRLARRTWLHFANMKGLMPLPSCPLHV